MDIFEAGRWGRRMDGRRVLAQAAPQTGNPVADARQGVEVAKRIAETMVSNYTRMVAVVGEESAAKALDDAKAMLDEAEKVLKEAEASVPLVSES